MLIFDKELKALPAAARGAPGGTVSITSPGGTSFLKPHLPVPSSVPLNRVLVAHPIKPLLQRPNIFPKPDAPAPLGAWRGGEGTSAAGRGGAGAGQTWPLGEEGWDAGHLAATLRRGGKSGGRGKGREGVPSWTPHDAPLGPVDY